ncbi:MAG: hypothetical protein AAF700_07300 [Pseudomonadota bacterium]
MNPALRALSNVSRGVTNFLTIATNSGKIAEDVRKLNTLSEDELAKLGTSRAGEIERIFNLHAYQ